MESEWMYNNIADYVCSADVNLKHGWFEFKINGILEKIDTEYQEKVMEKIETTISFEYFKKREKIDTGEITYDEFLSKTYRYTDTFQILRNLRLKYNLPVSSILG